MKKLKIQVQMTLDGFIGGPNGELDFMVHDWDNQLKKYVGALTDTVDTIILGRKLAEGFIPYWASNPEQEGAAFFNQTPKVVFTKTLEQSPWPGTVLAKGDLAETVDELKKESGNDIIVYGGAGFVSSLIQHGLIDEFHLFINPTAIGKGLSIFGSLDFKQDLELINAFSFDCGIVVLHYQKK